MPHSKEPRALQGREDVSRYLARVERERGGVGNVKYIDTEIRSRAKK